MGYRCCCMRQTRMLSSCSFRCVFAFFFLCVSTGPFLQSTIIRLIASNSETNKPLTVPPPLLACFDSRLTRTQQANLLTGLVNVSLNTLETSSPRAVGVLVVYSAVVYGLAWTARGRKLL